MRVKTTELAQLPASCQLLVKLSQIMLSKHLDSTLSVCPWIAAGILRYSQAQIEDAARRANAWEFIESFPIPAPLVRVPPTNGRACAKSVERAHSRCREE